MTDYAWETRQGVNILIRDMDTFHIENVMRMIEKRNFVFHDSFGGDGFFDVNEIDMRPIYERMHLELRIRKLEETRND